jgi:MATE family multidrug resistance protein
MSALDTSAPSAPSSDSDQRTPGRARWRAELRTMLALAGPVILAEIGWMSMGIVDTLMVGPLGPQAIGATGLGASLFIAVAIFGMGLLLGLDTLVSQAFGARRLDECHRWLFHGVALALLLALPLMLIVWAFTRALVDFGLHPAVLPLATTYLTNVSYSMPPLLLYAACRRYLQGMGVVAPVTFALVSANLVNAFFNWVLIYGHGGFPALGVGGSAWATTLARAYMAAVLMVAIVWHDRRKSTGLWRVPRHISAARLRTLLALGFPAASQITLEVGVFALATALAARLEPIALAAHQIAINIASFTFMVPLGMSSASAVLVGQAVGRRDGPGAVRAGWMALGLVTLFMSVAAVVFIVTPRLLLDPFTRDAQVLSLGVALLFAAAVFQLFDGLQATSTGILRGIGDTRTPMISNFVGHWAIGLPIGWWACFRGGYGVLGLWFGLSTGLILVGITLVAVWAGAARRLRHLAT